MQHQHRKIQVVPGIEVSSVWAVPVDYGVPLRRAVILAHGAGNAMEHPFMLHFHRAFAEAGALSVRFNFPYAEAGRKAPDRMPMLESTWRAVIRTLREDGSLAPDELFLAGKSMGGRVASHRVADGESCRGLILLGYPLHPAGQPEKRRVDHWGRLAGPVLFVQGTRDPLCRLDLLQNELPRIPGPVTLLPVEGGDHSFKPPAGGETPEGVWTKVAASVVDWMAQAPAVA